MIGAAALLPLFLAQQPAPVLIAFPEPLATAAVPVVQRLLGEVAAVLAVDPVSLATRTEPAVIVGVAELTLQRLQQADRLRPVQLAAELPPRCRGPGGAFVLPFAVRYVLVHRPALLATPAVPATWDALALEPLLHDRLGLCDPSIDPAPWLAAMAQRVRDGDGERAGQALWTTLDARAGSYPRSHQAALAGVAEGRLLAALLPRAVLRSGAGATPAVELAEAELADGVFALAGIAVLGDASPAAAERLATPAAVTELTRALGLEPVAPLLDRPSLARVDLARAESWLQLFETSVRSRGRSAESVADWLDVVFGLVFLIFVVFAWLWLRRNERHDAIA
ncbi:MAG: hypothetical protein IPK26_08010 [Planctomycetes bacterium]|nr:hypothetical protein [Planctomycetota bacterium]